MKNFKIKVLLLLTATVLLTGCSNNSSNKIENNTDVKENINNKSLSTVTYTNLNDEETKNLTNKLLQNAGISDIRRKIFLDNVDSFNMKVNQDSLTKGFEKAKSTSTKYDPFEMQDDYVKKSPDFQGYNCRITAYSLFGDYIECNSTEELNSSNLGFDLESIEQNKDAINSEKDLNTFKNLYSTVFTTLNKDTAFQSSKFKEEWKKRKIKFKENDKLKLISVVFNDHFDDNDDELFIGHAGILLPQEDGTIYFLEKVSFQEPYRLNKFKNRKELKNYLMEKYDVSYNQPTSKPFILENDEIMK